MWRLISSIAFLSLTVSVIRCDTNYRLNTTVVPSAYSIAITPYFDTGDETAFTFDGEVSIKFTTTESINTIKLHSENLTFTAANITLSSGAIQVNLNTNNPLVFDEKYTFAIINFESVIPAGYEFVLKIVYKGPIRTDLQGFYRNYYIENGVKKWLGATQMESTHARKVFPCFDEPHLKAKFTLTIDRPEHYSPSLANTKVQTRIPLSNGYIREVFYSTPRMSTYLVAFLVSEFEAGKVYANGTKEFGIYTRPEAKNQTDYAFDFGLRVVQALGDYFGVDYYSTDPNIKLDHVALPDFRAGAMENWGLVKYRESLLLYVPEESTPYFKYRVAQIVAHETTHMWFGNLVTCHWWSDTWLNEGFANYFQDYITALIEPEVGSEDMLVIGSVYAAYDADDAPDSPPITNNNVNSPAEISGHFGTITYQKAGSVIRMMHHFIGDEAFRLGLNTYLKTNEFEPGYPDKLYSALNTGVSNYNSLSNFSGSDITSIMSSWVVQAGHPILHVDVDYENDIVTLTQKRFYINSSHESNEIYKIPITFTQEDDINFDNTKPVLIMDNDTNILKLDDEIDDDEWIIFNIQETGFYRVNYDDRNWKLISNYLKGSQREKIHHLNRAKIVNDLFAFLYADEVKFDLLRDVLGFLSYETDYAVWYAAIRGLNNLRNSYLGSVTKELVEDFALKLMDNIIIELGYEVRPTDDFITQRNRMQILEFACKLKHQGCLENSLEHYKSFKNNGVAIHPSLRSVAYCSGLTYGEAEDFDFMWNRMFTTNVANEARLIGDILGCTTVPEKLKSYLSSMLVENSPIKTQDLTVPLVSVLSNNSHVDIVLEVLKENMTLWNTVYPSMESVLSAIAMSLHTEDEFTNYEQWLSSCSECSEQSLTSAKSALNKARQATSWAEDHEADISTSLRSFSNCFKLSFVLLLLSIASLIVI